MKKIIIFLLCLLGVKGIKAQCTAPTYTLNFTGNPDTSTTITNKGRGGVCCVGSSTMTASSNCISFLVYTHPATEIITFNVTNPSPSGSGFYQVNCGAPVSIGTPLCTKGLGSPFTITYCKPGGDKPNYHILASGTVKGSKDITMYETGCKDTMFVSNVLTSSIVWTSIYPGPRGQYNNFLSCTSGCNTTLVSPVGTPPPYIDFEVSGIPNPLCTLTDQDTIRVYFVPNPTGTITPISPVLCSAATTSVTLTANVSGGAPPLKYDWSSDPGTNNLQSTTVSAAGTYTVVIKDKTKCPSLTLTRTISNIPPSAFSYPSSQFCKNSTNPSPAFVSGAQAGAFSATPAGLSFVSTSTGVINLAASAPGTYVVTNTIAPAGSCAGSSSTTTVTINPFPVMTSASSSSVCSGDVLNIPLSSSLSSNFSWFANNNPNVNGESTSPQSTTSITNTLTNATASSELVIYTVTPISTGSGNCVGTAQTITVTVRPKDDANFYYSSSTHCQTGADPSPTITGLNGGTFTSGPGLVFKNAAGKIDLSACTVGSYTVTYTTNGLCPNTHTFPVNITTAPSAGFSYTASPYCQNAVNPLPTFSANASGGTFSSGTGLVFANNLTGEINLAASTPGTYTVLNTISPSGLCGVSTATAAVTITGLKEAGFSYTASPVCQTSNDPFPTFVASGEAGTFSSTSGLSINASNGLVNLMGSIPGPYVVTNTIAAVGGCPVVTATTNITVTKLPIATFNYTATPFCSNSGDQLPVFTSGGVAGIFSASSVYLDVNSATGSIAVSNSTPGNYNVFNTIPASNGCPDVVATASVSITALPVAAITYGGPYCSNAANPTPTLNSNGTNGVYTFNPSGLSIDTGAGTVDLASSTPGTYTVTNTVAAANGCPAVSGSAPITITKLPVATFNYSATPYCINGSNPLPTYVGGGAPGTFSASAGVLVTATNGLVNLSGSTAGTHTVTNVIAASNGCPEVIATNTITINPVATASAASDATICAGSSYTLSGAIGGAASSLSWATSGSGTFNNAALANAIYTPSAADISAGTVTLTIQTNDPAGPCSSVSDAMTLKINPKPTANAGPTNTLTCSNTTLSLSGSGGGTYAWSGAGIVSGSTTATPVINAPGIYSLVVTSPLGCPSNISTVSISQNTVAPNVTSANTGSLNCTTLSVNASVTTSASPVSYSWSGTGITSATNGNSISVNQGGTFNYTVTNTTNNCKTFGSLSIIQNTVSPIVTSANTGSLNCTVLSVDASATTSTTPVNYYWAGPGITSATNISTITVTKGGTYNYTVTNPFNNCSVTGFQSITQNTMAPAVVSTASGSLNCTVLAVDASLTTTTSPVTYNWGGSGIVSSTDAGTITVNAGGIYNYTVTSTFNDCKTTGSQAVIQNTVSPDAITATTGSLNCTTLAVNVSATSSATPVSYNWNGTGITSATNISTITVNEGGAYVYTVTNTFNNCSSSGTVSVLQNTVIPVTAASTTGSITCITNTINLNSSLAGMNYAWTAPAGCSIINGASLQNATGQGLGTYTVNVTDPDNSCTFSVTVSAVQDTTAPTNASAGADQTLICGISQVTLSGAVSPANSGINWLGGVCGSATSCTTSACNAGTYTMVATHPVTGCEATSTVAVVSATNAPQATVNPVTNSITCTNHSVSIGVTLNNTDPVSYSWSGPGASVSSDTSVIVATAGGTYSVVVTNTVTNCVANYNITVPTDTTPVTVNIAPASSITCSSPSTTLSAGGAGSGYTYDWSGNGIVSGGTTANPVVNQGGNFSVVVTNPVSGCAGTASVTVPSNTAIPVVSISVPSITTTCTDPTTTLSIASTPSTDVTYTWSEPSTGALNNYTIPNPVASGSGIFTVVVTNTISGCTSSLTQHTVEVYWDNVIPTATVSASSLSITCSVPTPSVNLSASVGTASYSWSPASGIVSGTENSATPSFSLPGSYSVIVTNTTNGCASSSGLNEVTVSLDNTAPVVSINGGVNNGTITCSTTSVTISSTATPVSNLVYSWTSGSGSGISGASDQATATFTSGGTYTLSVTNTVTGCSSAQDASSVFTVTQDTAAPVIFIASPSVTTTCSSPTAALSITSTPSTAVTYSWTSPATGSLDVYNTSNPVASGSGIFTVSVTNTITGCTSSPFSQNTVNVVPDMGIPTVTLSANSLSITCSNPTPTVNVSTNPTVVSFSWTPTTGIVNGTETSSSPSFSLPGTYSLVVTNTVSGCATFINDNNVTIISDNIAPVVSLTSPVNNGTVSCLTPSVSISSSVSPNTGLTYVWTSGNGAGIAGATNQASATFTASGVYMLSVTNTVTGCSSVIDGASTFFVFADTAAPVANFNFVTGCAKDSVKFIDLSTASSGNITDWHWSFGDGNNSMNQNPSNAYAQSDSYTVSLQVRAANGCAGTSKGVVSLIPPVIADFTPGGGDFLINQHVSFTNQSSGSTNYSWNFGDGNTDAIDNPTHVYKALGSYKVSMLASNSLGCKDSISFMVNIKPSGYAIPSGFTPNGDGVNDGFSVLGGPFITYELRIFNAWGNEIFVTTSPTEKWDGTYRDQQQPAGTYIYVFNGKVAEGDDLRLKGEVNIIR